MNSKKKFLVDTSYAFITYSFLAFIRFLRKPILARFLGPEGMGLFSMITMIMGMIERFASLGIPAALIKFTAESRHSNNSKEILSTAYLSLTLIGTLSAFLLIIFSERIAMFFEMPELGLYLKIYAISTPFSFIYSINLAFLNGKRDMKKYSFLEVIKSTLNFIVIIVFLYLGYGLIGVIAGSILALLIALIVSIKKLDGEISISFTDIFLHARKLISLGLKLMLAGTINLLNYEADILLIGYFLTAQDVGYYSVAISLTYFLWIIPDSIKQVSYPTTAMYWTNKEYNRLNEMFDKTIKLSTIFMLIAGISVIFFANTVVSTLFGSNFLGAVKPLQILIFGTIIYGSLNKPIGSSLAAAGLVNMEIYKVAISAIVNILLNLTLIPIYGITGGAVATTISLTVAATINIYLVNKYLKYRMDLLWYLIVFILTFGIVFIYYININFSLKLIILLLYNGILLFMLPKKEIKYILRELQQKISKINK